MSDFDLYLRAVRIWKDGGSKKGFSVSDIEEFIVEWEESQRKFGVLK